MRMWCMKHPQSSSAVDRSLWTLHSFSWLTNRAPEGNRFSEDCTNVKYMTNQNYKR